MRLQRKLNPFQTEPLQWPDVTAGHDLDCRVCMRNTAQKVAPSTLHLVHSPRKTSTKIRSLL